MLGNRAEDGANCEAIHINALSVRHLLALMSLLYLLHIILF